MFFLIVHFSIHAQVHVYPNPYLKFDQLTIKDGLSGNYILDIYQDREGYIWIATTDGLNRYNGYTIENFRNIAGDTASISANLITCLAEDENGNLLIGTKKGLNVYDKNTNSFLTRIHSFNFPDTLSTAFIREIYPDSNHLIWVETASGKLIKVNTKTGGMKFFEHSPPTMVNTYFYHAALKDQNGFLWLGGRYMGMFRFDPKSEGFHQIYEDPEDNTKKRDNDVAVYFEDSEGTFWVGGIDGLYTMDREKETFSKRIPISTFSICEDKNQNLWIATGSGLFIYNLQEKGFYNCVHNDNNKNSIINNHLNKVFIDRAGNIWLGSTGGISIFRPSKNKFKHYYHIAENPNTPVSNHITAILQDNQNRIWLGTANKGVEFFDEHLNKLGDYSYANNNHFKLASDRISTLMQDKDGDIWIGQWSGRGFNIVNPANQTNYNYSLLKNSLKADWYSDFMQSKNGEYWVGIWGSTGLFKFDKKTGSFMNNRYIAPYTNLKKPIYNMAFDGNFLWLNFKRPMMFFCFLPEKEKYYTIKREFYFEYDFTDISDIWNANNKTYFQTDNGTYTTLYNPYLSVIKTTRSVNETPEDKARFNKLFPHIKVTSVKQDKDGYYWLGSETGVHKVKDKLIIATYNRNTLKNGLFPSDTILSLEFTAPETLWLGTEKGLAKFNINTLKVIDYTSLNNKYLNSHLIKFLFEDSKQNIWVGTTNKGLNKLDPSTGNIRQYPHNSEDSTAFWGKEAVCMIEDKNGIRWIGGYGINKYLPEVDGFYHYTETDGLVNNEVRGMLEDEDGFLWISTTNGLSKFNTEKETFQNFYEKDGLQDNEFSEACFKLNDGRLVFGGKNGLNIFDPQQIEKNKIPPQLVLTGFKVFEKPMDSLLIQGSSIELKYHQNYFSFDFAALDFSNPEKNRYAFKLENFHEDWVYTQEGNHEARYTNVDPGNYLFRVKAANSDGIWNENGISIPIVIQPPFWRTSWFYTLIILLNITLVFFLIKYRERKIKGQNRLLSLEQRLLRSQMNPHFIFNSLSSIQSFIFESNPIEAGSYLSRFAELIRSILYNSREEYIPIEKEIKTLQNYLDLQQLRYNKKFEYDIDVDLLLDKEEILIPPMLAQPFIENAIEHGIKYIDGKGFISVSFTLMDNTILLIIEDNGIGIRAAKKQSNKKAKEHISLATLITRERIEIFNKGNKQKPFSMSISDAKDVKGKIIGTKVKLIIPYVQT